MKKISLCILAVITICSCAAKKELESVNPGMGFKWNMTMDDTEKIAKKHHLKFIWVTRELGEAPEYKKTGLRGEYSKGFLYISCGFWADSLFSLEIFSPSLGFIHKMTYLKKLLDKAAMHQLVKNMQIDTIDKKIQPVMLVHSQYTAVDSSQIYYSTHHLIWAEHSYSESEQGRLEIYSSNYNRFGSYMAEFKNKRDKEFWEGQKKSR